ncbi:HEPN domain-containing protein [Ignisphaera sp. 4213-co]|uniref:HEPN domain-containing protein n=1 Tax=Ignisphaera cupida TaxID=3050454 RepID=A0ABD4Z6D2_9CREN|nr:HEPN domain-containing protein [Ignisphaera sp. 4213-co]MDK6028730.1 HEPN domain-containing protein [Ignisphaera sp. 4213-co]
MKSLKLLVDWIEKADIFLSDAEKHLAEGHYWLVCFESHQAAELYPKSLIVSATGFHPYTHDLLELVDALKSIGINVEEDIVIASDLLTPHYTLSRYPGRKTIKYNRERAERCLGSAKKVVEWVKRVADP